ncbi:putative ribonuclease H protein At1g65750 family [Senna tora]|uniref:Putative ribonuclease H protein At1g65750 family n=1 Tax=Senna tora TaxID=362788 RepID=A0A834WYD7_9FABA|nr:putative ribonuclease H protein At1g65750 family [Senna tora]
MDPNSCDPDECKQMCTKAHADGQGLCTGKPHEVEKKSRNFTTSTRKKMHMVNWNTLCNPKDQGGLGLRALEHYNQAFLMKMGWGIIIHKSNDLWAQVLRGKYACGNDIIPQVKSRMNSSNLWRGVSKVWHNVENNLCWRIGNGLKVNFWHDVWMHEYGPLKNHLLTEMREDEIHYKAVQYSIASGDWDWAKFIHLLPDEIVKNIAGIQAPNEHAGEDMIFWGLTNDGNFSVKSAYHAIAGFRHENVGSHWKFIWKWPVIQRVRSFLWLVAHERDITNLYRFNCNLSNSSLCPRCCNQVEDVLHAIRDCPEIKKLWQRLVRPQHWNTFFNLNVTDWLIWNWKNRIGVLEDVNWRTTFGFTCWISWKHRNEVIFENSIANNTDLFFSVLCRGKEYASCNNNRLYGVQQARSTKFIRWKPPRDDFVKCNVDGSVYEGKDAACGGLLRDAAGDFITCFSSNLGRCSITVAELHAIQEGLKMAWDHGYRNIIMEVDSQIAIDLIQKEINPLHPHCSIVKSIQHLMNRDWRVIFQHTYREGNGVADFLAHWGHELGIGTHYMHELPSEGEQILADDRMGICFPRVCVV